MTFIYIIGIIFIIYLLLAYNGRPSKTREICEQRYNYFKNTLPNASEKEWLTAVVEERFPTANSVVVSNFVEQRLLDIDLVIEGIIIAEASGSITDL